MPRLLTGADSKDVKITLKELTDEGAFEAVFATLNVIDHDQDVTIPGAFSDQDVIIFRSHQHRDLAVGRGSIHEDDGKMEATVKGRFFLDTTHGMDTYKTVKQLDELQEWSYGFQVVDADFGQFQGQEVRLLKKLDVFEVSPVARGAGIGTRTTDIKTEAGQAADGKPKAQTLSAQTDRLLADLSDWATRVGDLKSLRAEDDRELSARQLEKLVAVKAQIEAILEKPPATVTDVDRDRILRLHATYGKSLTEVLSQ